jgi:hypothetical protein
MGLLNCYNLSNGGWTNFVASTGNICPDKKFAGLIVQVAECSEERIVQRVGQNVSVPPIGSLHIGLDGKSLAYSYV